MKTQKQLKGAVGLDVVEAVIMSLLIIGVLSIASLMVFYSLQPSVDTASTLSYKTNNETGFLNASGYTLAQASAVYNFASPSISVILNATDNATIGSGNYTLTGNVLTNATAVTYTSIRITYTYKASNSGASQIIGNITSANTSFFGNSSTFFSILAVVVIIALISLIILYIRDFRKEGGVKATA